MTLRRKTVLAIGVTMTLLLAGLYITSSQVILENFAQLEREDVYRNVDRAVDSLYSVLERLHGKTTDWAMWDEAVAFVRHQDEASIRANLVESALSDGEISLVAIVDASSGASIAIEFDQDLGEIPLSESVRRMLAAKGSLFSAGQETGAVGGLILLPEGPMLISSRALSIDGEARNNVRIIAGQRMDDRFASAFAKRTGLTLSLYALNDPEQPQDCVEVAPLLTHATTRTVKALSDSVVAGYAMLEDIDGEPAVLLSARQPRVIYQQGHASVRYLLESICVACLLMGLIMLVVLERSVVAPLVRLNAQVRRAGAERQSTDPISLPGSDELSSLAGEINAMRDSLRKQEARLREARDEARAKAAELERTSEQLRAAWEAAETASRAKTYFLANTSHEIRTPMTSILGYAELLLDPRQSSSDRVNCVQTIRRNGQHLLEIINDILDISKIEAGKLSIEQVECSPCQTVADVASLMRGRAVEKRLTFEVSFNGPMPKKIRTDPTRLRQILINLCGNAVKFTERGGVQVSACVLDGERPQLRISVADTGVGLTNTQCDRLFHPFSQADSSTTRRYGGTGLGLAISKRLAEALGGDITLESEPGEGSIFTLTVDAGPLNGIEWYDEATEIMFTTVEEPPPPGTRDEGKPAPLAGVRILLAEDGPDNQRLISFVLGKAGAQVTIAENGAIAVEKILSPEAGAPPFDVILMDMQMPEMDGYAASAKLRASGCTIPIIALTAHAMAGDREKCLKAGCDDYAAKPVDRTALVELIIRYVRSGSVART